MSAPNLTANGTLTFDAFLGRNYTFGFAGDFGGGTLAVNYLLDGVPAPFPDSPVTAPGTFAAVTPGTQIQLVLTGATAPDIEYSIAPTAEQGEIQNQLAIAAEEAARIASFPDSTPFNFIGFYDDFTIQPDGAYDVTPIVGADQYRQHFNGESPGTMLVEGGGLRCPVGSNNYLGSSIATPNGVLDVTFELVTVNPPGKYNRNGSGFTFTFKETQIVVNDGSGIAVSGSIHINIDSDGNIIPSHFQQATPFPKLTSGESLFQWPSKTGSGTLQSSSGSQIRWRVNIRAYGDRLEVTSRGRTIAFQCSAIAGRIGSQKTWFYFQLNNIPFAGSPVPADRNYTRLERMWANAPALSLMSAVRGESSSRFDGNGKTIYPGDVDYRLGDAPFVGHDIASRNEPYRFGGATISGNTYIGGGTYTEGLIRKTAPVTGINSLSVQGDSSWPLTTALASPVNASLGTNFMGLRRVVNLPNGVHDIQRVTGTFGANTNPKQIQVKEAGTTIFDTGSITPNGETWELEITRSSLVGASETYIFKFFSATTGLRMSTVAVNRGATYTTLTMHVLGTAAGDVTVHSRRAHFANQF